MKLLKNNIKLIVGFILGIIISSGVVYAVSTISDSSEITFDNTGTALSSTNVESALTELATKIGNGGTSQAVELGTNTSYNIATLYPNIDYTQLTVDNFYYKIGNRSFGSVSSNLAGGNAAYLAFASPTISYDNSTGIVSCTRANINTIGSENTSSGSFVTIYLPTTLYMIAP